MRHPSWLKAVALALALVGASADAQAPGDLRVALVIGNAAYAGGAALANPGNDARAMTAAMKGLGFSVIDLHDAGKAQMTAAIARMRDELRGKRAIAVLYYAGHGVQHDWRNFMVPVDASLKEVDDIPAQSVELAQVLDAFRDAGTRLNVVVLDACRDNPFGVQHATTRGLAPLDAPTGTFVAFATTPGNVAEDGDDRSGHGLYTQLLLNELARPASRLEDMFRRVKLQVRFKSKGRQVPSESSNLVEDFSFDKGFAPADAESRDARLRRYGEEKAEWDRIRNSTSAEDFYAFLQRHPSGFITELAQFRYDQLQKPLLVAQARRDGTTTLVSGTNRYALGDEYTLQLTDLLTGLVRREPHKVTYADDTRVEINGGQVVYDQMGGLVEDETGVKDPPVLMVPADIALGKQWRAVFQNHVQGFSFRVLVDFRTVAFEDVQVAGKTIKAFRVEMEGFISSLSIRGTLWIEPRTMRMVRWDRHVRAPGHTEASRIEITDARPARR